ncbi:polymorphic toxin-type HINT domain-containing protein [Peribacillus frigoritolerans]|uniref:polymorphic toxin-type HINT domain-containing protein n=1 Tax=Peribacillus frigoritolerans TaxID=450367 RepID=UPI003CFD01D6
MVGEGWVEAKNIVAGDLVETNDGNTIRIDTIEIVQKQETVYNFKVQDYHSYYVSDIGIGRIIVVKKHIKPIQRNIKKQGRYTLVELVEKQPPYKMY